jgi:hypothetical protein
MDQLIATGSVIVKQQVTLCAALVALGLGAATAAHAQYAPIGPRAYAPGLPPFEIMRIVRAAGLAPLSQPVRRGPGYVLIARDRAGTQLRVVVDAYAGQIVRARPIVVAMRPYAPVYVRPYGAPVAAPYPPAVAVSPYAPRIAAVPPREIKDPPPVVYAHPPGAEIDADGLPPVPRHAVPNARIATAPSATLAARPAVQPRTPLPRPRPSVAENESTDVTTPAPAPAPAEAKPEPASGTKAAPKDGELKLVPVAPLE